jgi:hypothetical protein
LRTSCEHLIAREFDEGKHFGMTAEVDTYRAACRESDAELIEQTALIRAITRDGKAPPEIPL